MHALWQGDHTFASVFGLTCPFVIGRQADWYVNMLLDNRKLETIRLSLNVNLYKD